MRVMVLDPAQLHPLLVQGPLGGQVLGMEVVRDELGPHVEQPLEVRNCFRKRPEGLKILQIPNVLRDSKVAGARFPEWEYAQKTLENQGLLCRLEGCQTPLDTGANPCGDAHASLATYTTFSLPSSPFSAVRKPGTL